jgi:putative transposase
MAPRQRNRELTVKPLATVSVGERTDLPTGEGGLYRAVVLELCSRAVVRWAMANHMRVALVSQAVAMAIGPRQPAVGLIMHTDRGRQYGADSYRTILTQHGMPSRMSRQGDCEDNAVAESCFHTLKTDLIYREDFDTHEYAQTAVFEAIEVFYNRQRCHSAQGSMAPLASEQPLRINEVLCPGQCWHITRLGHSPNGAIEHRP